MRCLPLLALNLLMITPSANAAVDESSAEAVVKNTPCIHNLTIEAMLNTKIKTGSQRDLGWQVFKEDNHLEVERAFLINKSMQLRFRWQVNEDGSITPISKRAETLCTPE